MLELGLLLEGSDDEIEPAREPQESEEVGGFEEVRRFFSSCYQPSRFGLWSG